MTTWVGTILDCSLWPIDATTWIVLTPDGDEYAERCADYSRMRVPPLGGGEMPEVGSVEINRGWTLNELSELVREGRNLALCARTSMGLTHYRDPTMMCDLSGRLFLLLRIHLQTPRVRSDRVVSVSEHVWVRVAADRIDRWRFGSVVALHC